MSNCLNCGRDLRQANAVIDAIGTLTENDRTLLTLAADFCGRAVELTVSDGVRGWSYHKVASTLREALEACVAARDQYDKERTQ